MKTYSVKALILCPIFLFCINKSSNCQTRKSSIIVLNREPPIIYLGVDNYLGVGDLSLCDSIQWYVDNGTIATVDNTCTAIVKPKTVGRCVVSLKDRKSGRTIDIDTLQVDNLPRPQIWLSGKSGGEISKKHLRVQLGVKAYFESPPIQNNYAIKSFVIILIKNRKVEMCYNYGPTFDTEARALLGKVDVGSKLIIANVIVLNSLSEIIRPSPAEFDIVD